MRISRHVRRWGVSTVLTVLAIGMLSCTADADVGAVAPDLFSLSRTARLSALAAGLALEGDAGTMELNPASLAGTPQTLVSAGYGDWYLDTHSIRLDAVLSPLGENGALGIALVYFSEGEVEDFNPLTGEYESRFENSQMGAMVGYGMRMPRIEWLSVGLSADMVSRRLLGETGGALGLSGGLTADLPGGMVRAGLSFRGVASQSGFQEQADEPAARTWASGLCIASPEDVWKGLDALVCCDVVKERESGARVAFGGEVTILDVLVLRAGHDAASEDAPMRYGMGLRISGFRLDYTYADHQALGATNSISLLREF